MNLKEDERRRALFKCQHTGLTGMYVGTKSADAPNHNKDAVQVVYIPFKDLNKSGIRERWKGVTEYKELWKVTNTKYPREAMIGPKPVPEPNKEDGLFDQQVVMPHNIRGEANWQENFVDKDLQGRIDQKDARIKELEKQLGNKEIEKMTQEDNSQIEDDNRRGSRRNVGNNVMNFEEETRGENYRNEK